MLAGLVGLVLTTGCGDSTTTTVDSGPDVDAADTAVSIVQPEAPMPPAPPALTPCAAGWEPREIEAGATVCQPSGGSLPACEGIERAAIGESACRSVGHACGSGEWPDVSDATGTVRYVRAGATGGDGTMGAPFGDVQPAVRAAGAGDIVAIAAGTYGGLSIDVIRDVELRGACPSDVVLEARVSVARASVTVEDVTIVNANQAADVSMGGSLTLRGVAILDATTLAINVTDGSHLDATDVLVRDVRPQPSDGAYGWGVNVDFGSDATIRQSEIIGVRGVAISALLDGLQVTIEDSVIRGTVEDSSGTGRAFTVGAGATLHASRVVVDQSTEFAAVADGAEARLVVEDSLVARTRPTADGELGGGIAVQNEGALELRRSHLADNHRAALQIATRSMATLEDVVVTDTEPEPSSGIFGRALLAGSGADVTVRRFVALRSHDSAILAAGGSTVLRLEDTWVKDVSQVEQPDSPLHAGRGLTVGLGARAEVARLHIEGAGDVGILTDDAQLDASDVLVRDMQGETSSGALGHGMQSLRSSVTLTRARFERCRAAGVVVGVAPSEATLSDLTIADTRERLCAETTCPELGAGIGLTVLEGGYADVSRFAITGGALCGLQLASGGTADARDGLVADNPIGANVQTEGFDISRITTDVHYDNDFNLDSSALPVPMVTRE